MAISATRNKRNCCHAAVLSRRILDFGETSGDEMPALRASKVLVETILPSNLNTMKAALSVGACCQTALSAGTGLNARHSHLSQEHAVNLKLLPPMACP